MTLQTVFLWLYSAMASLVFGAAVYETLVVHPAWSRKPPESFVAFMGTPVGRMNLAAFWIPVAPLFALSALASVAVAAMQGTPNLILIASAACAVAAVVWTLTYFRPTVVRFLEQQGAMLPPSAFRRRRGSGSCSTALIAVSWFGVLAASHL